MPRHRDDANFWLDRIAEWSEMPWSIVEPGKRAQAQTPLGIYVVDVEPNNKFYVLRFIAEADEHTCPTRFTATNRVAWEADDHYRRLLAQQQQPARMKPPKW